MSPSHTKNGFEMFEAEGLTGDAFRARLQELIADRRSQEAAAFFQTLLTYVHRRARRALGSNGAQIQPSEHEEIVSEVLLQLMRGSLANFRGGSMGELIAFVRTVTDRVVWRTVTRKRRDQSMVEAATMDDMRQWTAELESPDANAEVEAESPLSTKDQEYLVALFKAGSKASYARHAGVSRAAVTQRVQRIKTRIAELSKRDRATHDVWVSQQVRIAAAFADE